MCFKVYMKKNYARIHKKQKNVSVVTYVVDANLSLGRGFHEGTITELSRKVQTL